MSVEQQEKCQHAQVIRTAADTWEQTPKEAWERVSHLQCQRCGRLFSRSVWAQEPKAKKEEFDELHDMQSMR